MLTASGRAAPIVTELQRKRTQTQDREKETDTLRGAEWTDPISGRLNIPEANLKIYPKGGRRHDNLLLGSGDFTQKLSLPAQQRLRDRSGPADELRAEIAHFTGSDVPAFFELTPQQQAAEVTDEGIKRLRRIRNGVVGYLDRFKEPLQRDPLKVKEKSNLIDSIRKNQDKIGEGGLSDAELAKAQNLTMAMRIRLASLVGETEFTAEKLERKIKEFDDAEAAEKDMDEFVWKAGQTKALTRVADFKKYIKPAKFSNGKYEHQIVVGEGDGRGDLYDKTYFEKVYLPGSKDKFYLDVKDDFRRWLPTYTETIPQFVKGEGGKMKEVWALNPSGVKRSMIYLPPQMVVGEDGLPAGSGGVAPEGPKDASFIGTPGYDEFWTERPEMLGTGAIERQKIRALYNVGEDGNIEAPVVPAQAAPKVIKETDILKRVPRRGEPRAEVDEAANLFEDAKADAKAMTTLVEFFRQATAEEKAAMEAVRGDEEAQIAILRGIMQRVNKPVD